MYDSSISAVEKKSSQAIINVADSLRDGENYYWKTRGNCFSEWIKKLATTFVIHLFNSTVCSQAIAFARSLHVHISFLSAFFFVYFILLNFRHRPIRAPFRRVFDYFTSCLLVFITSRTKKIKLKKKASNSPFMKTCHRREEKRSKAERNSAKFPFHMCSLKSPYEVFRARSCCSFTQKRAAVKSQSIDRIHTATRTLAKKIARAVKYNRQQSAERWMSNEFVIFSFVRRNLF